MDMDIWQSKRVDGNAFLHWHVGPLHVYVRRAGDEWHVARRRDDASVVADEPEAAAVGTADPPEETPPERWVIGSDCEPVARLKPIMPDRPVVVRPESPVRMPPGASGVFHVSIAVFVAVTVGKDETLLCEIPTVELSKIWFGDFAEGELCYSLKTRARRTAEEHTPRHHRAVCPVTIANEGDSELRFDRVCIHVDRLRVFRGDGCLLTNGVTVTRRNDDAGGRITYSRDDPPGKALLADARRPDEPGVLRRSFRNFALFNRG